MDSNRMWIPMMLFSGILNIMFFASMMSFMGMAMNPAESAVTEGQVDQNTAGAEDTAGTGDSSDVGTGERIPLVEVMQVLRDLIAEVLVIFNTLTKAKTNI